VPLRETHKPQLHERPRYRPRKHFQRLCEMPAMGRIGRNPEETGDKPHAGTAAPFGTFFRACQRSYCTCIFNQNSGDVPSAAESRSDIPAVIPSCPFKMRDNVALVTRRRAAASLTVMPPR
jgi:hypothetical protein